VRRLLPALVLPLLVPTLVACGDDEGGGDATTTVTVLAAASLTSTFEQLADDFEAEHEGVEVELVFAGSSDLVTNIQNGDDADVFASADQATMDKLAADELGQEPQVFATNTLEIVVAPGNPEGITGLGDLTGDLDLVVCAPEVPCGAAAQGVAEAAGITLDPVSEEQKVTDVLAKVTSGQADAGLVYVTDVIGAGDDVEGVEFPESSEVVNDYPISTIAGSDEADLAADFVELVLSAEGRAVLAEAGFGTP
jgi:molybdate transport system substrate-binding protein